jgi:hypothetical protein
MTNALQTRQKVIRVLAFALREVLVFFDMPPFPKKF